MNLLDLLQAPPVTGAGTRIYGVVTGVVTNNQDPEKLGRVKVKFRWLSEEDESPWARVAVPMAGDQIGTWFLPEVEDEVLVAFERGDPRFPYVLGALWSQNAPPPETNDDGENNLRLIKSRSGHLIRLDDKDGDEKIEIIDKSEKNSIVIKTSDNSLTIQCDGDLTLESTNGKLVLKAKSAVEVTTDDALKVEAMKDAELKSSGGQVTVKGTAINLN